MPTETLESYPTRSKDILWRDLDGEAFLLSDDGRQIDLFNKTASFAWQLSDGKISIADIISKVVDRFDVTYQVAQRDMLALFQRLLEKELIQINGRPLDGEKL